MKVSIFFSLSFLWKNMEHVDSPRWDNATLLKLGVNITLLFRLFLGLVFKPSAKQLIFFIASHFPLWHQWHHYEGFIWLIKASSFWAISRRTRIKLPQFQRWSAGALVRSTRFALFSQRKGIDIWKVVVEINNKKTNKGMNMAYACRDLSAFRNGQHYSAAVALVKDESSHVWFVLSRRTWWTLHPSTCYCCTTQFKSLCTLHRAPFCLHRQWDY